MNKIPLLSTRKTQYEMVFLFKHFLLIIHITKTKMARMSFNLSIITKVNQFANGFFLIHEISWKYSINSPIREWISCVDFHCSHKTNFAPNLSHLNGFYLVWWTWMYIDTLHKWLLATTLFLLQFSHLFTFENVPRHSTHWNGTWSRRISNSQLRCNFWRNRFLAVFWLNAQFQISFFETVVLAEIAFISMMFTSLLVWLFWFFFGQSLRTVHTSERCLIDVYSQVLIACRFLSNALQVSLEEQVLEIRVMIAEEKIIVPTLKLWTHNDYWSGDCHWIIQRIWRISEEVFLNQNLKNTSFRNDPCKFTIYIYCNCFAIFQIKANQHVYIWVNTVTKL